MRQVARAGSGGVLWALFAGLSIGLPPVLLFGSQYLKDKCAADCLSGKKARRPHACRAVSGVPSPCAARQIICLAITEPYAGSDVASLKTTAVKSPCGKFYIVNGEKKWITNGATRPAAAPTRVPHQSRWAVGVFADFFTVAVRTGGAGAGGVSMLLIERSMPGVTTKQMKCMGVPTPRARLVIA
jgi:alkylation response protein AidB-like acyl-CoA dehydrogenase